MNIYKLHFAVDKSIKNTSFKKYIFKNNKQHSLNQCDVIVVIGGDGFMLQILKKYYKYKKPFYGMNKGTFGFLLNKFKKENIQKRISKAKQVTISPLIMKTVTKNKKIFSEIAINEVSLLRQSRQTASLKISNNKKIIIRKLVCDGVLVSTPAGSTAYNLSIHGPILSLHSRKLAITPISPFRPRRWRGKVVSSSSSIKIKNLNIKKRPISVVADNFEVRNVRIVNIKTDTKKFFKLLYDHNNHLSKKIRLERIKINNF